MDGVRMSSFVVFALGSKGGAPVCKLKLSAAGHLVSGLQCLCRGGHPFLDCAWILVREGQFLKKSPALFGDSLVFQKGP